MATSSKASRSRTKGQSVKAAGGKSGRTSAKTSGAAKRGGEGKAPSTRSASSKRTTSHAVIRKWVEARGGKPSIVGATKGRGKSAGLLRIDFPGYRGEGSLQELSWDQFFETFDANDLVFLYQEKTATGRPSRFSKFVSKSSARK